MRPFRCACLPASSGKASKIAKVEGPRRIANQLMVAGSCCARGSPLLRRFATSTSLPGFASKRTKSAVFTMESLLVFYLFIALPDQSRKSQQDVLSMLRRGKQVGE